MTRTIWLKYWHCRFQLIILNTSYISRSLHKKTPSNLMRLDLSSATCGQFYYALQQMTTQSPKLRFPNVKTSIRSQTPLTWSPRQCSASYGWYHFFPIYDLICHYCETHFQSLNFYYLRMIVHCWKLEFL